MKEIKLVGGDFDGKVIKVSDDVFEIDVLFVYTKQAFSVDVDYMSGCHEPEEVQYRKSLTDAHIWEVTGL